MTKQEKGSVALNLLIFLLAALATWMMMTGFRFSGGIEVFSARRLAAFKYFTVDSNVLMGVTALAVAILRLRHPGTPLPRWLGHLQYIATAAVTLTLMTVVLFLGPVVLGSYATLFNDSNLFFHLIIPVLSILDYATLERRVRPPFRTTLLATLPMLIYGAFYIVGVLRHMEQGTVSFQYDWYGFVRGGISSAFVSFGAMFLSSWAIGILLWLSGKRRQ